MTTPEFYVLTSLGNRIPLYSSMPDIDSVFFSVNNLPTVNVANYGGTRIRSTTVISFENYTNMSNYISDVFSVGEYLLPNPDSNDGAFIFFSLSEIPNPDTSISGYPTKAMYGHGISDALYVIGGYGIGYPDTIDYTKNIYLSVSSDGGIEISTLYAQFISRSLYYPIYTISGVRLTIDNIREFFLTEDVSNEPVNFYRTQNGEYTGEPIVLKRGESSGRLTFDIVFETGAVPYSGEVLFESIYKDKYFTVETNSITVLNNAAVNEISIIAKPVNYPDLITYITLIISDPLGPYDEGGTSGPSGGGGGFGKDEISDTIPLPNGSTEQNSSSAGMFTKYLVGTSELTAFADYLWADNLLDALLKEIVQLIYGSASEAIISLLSIPFNPQSLGVSGRQGNIFIGSADSGVSAPILGSTFASWNWGSIQIPEYWGSFLDYAPHTKIELYLPFNVGFVTIDPNDVMDGTISITTNFEFDKGTCVHIVSGKNGVIGTYDGIIGRQLPITALDTSGKALSLAVGAVAAAVSLGSGAMGAAAAGASAEQATYNYGTGAPFNPITIVDSPSGAQVRSTLQEARRAAEAPFTRIQTASNRVAAVSSLAAFSVPASIQRSGTMTGNGAGMNIQTPFIRVSRPTQSVPENYGHYVGYPSNILATLGTLRGYTEIASIHLDDFSCTIEEREEIDRLLKGGVIL